MRMLMSVKNILLPLCDRLWVVKGVLPPTQPKIVCSISKLSTPF